MFKHFSKHEGALLSLCPPVSKDLHQLQWWPLGFGDTTGVAGLISLVIAGHLLVHVFVGIWLE